jgi:hypothetical protein
MGVVTLNPAVREAVDEFVSNAMTASGPTGLWVWGPRCSGTSTAAKYARSEFRKHAEIVTKGPAQYVRASELLSKIRREWIQRDILRQNGSDFAVWQDWMTLDLFFETLWSAPLTWIDDVFEETDSEFFKKFVLPYIDKRTKEGLITIISGQVSPEKFGTQWAVALRSRFAIIHRTADPNV